MPADPAHQPDGDDRRDARQLAARTREVGRKAEREPWRDLLRKITGGRLGRHRGQPFTQLDTPWQDTPSPLRTGWRQRAANLHGEPVFAVDYAICTDCGIAWVEEPHTDPPYQRCGLASAGLAALRDEHPGMAWHTLGGHFKESQPFRAAAGEGVPGGYQQRPRCPHVPQG